MTEPSTAPTNTLQQGNEWLKPVDPNEGERKWAQYAAATTPPRRSGTNSSATTPQSSSPPSRVVLVGVDSAPAAVDSHPSAPRPVSSNTPPTTPPMTMLVPPKHVASEHSTQLFAQIDGQLVPVSLGPDGSIIPITLHEAPSSRPASSSPPFEFDSDCDAGPRNSGGSKPVVVMPSPSARPIPTAGPSWVVSSAPSPLPTPAAGGWAPNGAPPSPGMQSTTTPHALQQLPSAVGFESQNAWILLQQQQQLLYQLQQQQAVTAAALAGIAAKSHSVTPMHNGDAWHHHQGQHHMHQQQIQHHQHHHQHHVNNNNSNPELGSDGSSALVSHSDCGLSGQGSATATPTMTQQHDNRVSRSSRQDALLHQLRSTTITLPPPPPPPAPDRPFAHSKKKNKLEALMNSLQYTDLLTPSYSSKEQTQSETGVVVETPDDDIVTPMGGASPPFGSSTTTPSGFSPGYRKKACRAYFSSTGCKHGERCLFNHASPADGS